MTPRERLMALFRGDGTQTHYELLSSRGGRHVVPAMDAADIILDAISDSEENRTVTTETCPTCRTSTLTLKGDFGWKADR